MKYLAAYLLLNAGGKANPSADEVKSILSSVGAEIDEERVSSLISALAEKDIAEVKIKIYDSNVSVVLNVSAIAHC
jgi:large subunit ribosomal protein LP2